MAIPTLPPDFKEFVKWLTDHQVEYLLIGGYAVVGLLIKRLYVNGAERVSYAFAASVTDIRQCLPLAVTTP